MSPGSVLVTAVSLMLSSIEVFPWSTFSAGYHKDNQCPSMTTIGERIFFSISTTPAINPSVNNMDDGCFNWPGCIFKYLNI